MLAKQLLLTGALVASAGLKVGKDLGWYAVRRLNEPAKRSGSRPASAR
jgi:hypothetical protein